eukprot:NODE_73_length_24441_cov_0.672952.p8 type:complete len:343 gc:universal NODE_73_length_24441_cov_0.672952:10943-9915(-)
MNIESSLCMCKIPNTIFDDGKQKVTHDLNIFQCLYTGPDQSEMWMTFLSFLTPSGYFTHPLTKQTTCTFENKVFTLNEGDVSVKFEVPKHDDTLYELLRMYTSLSDMSKANKLVMMDNYGKEQAELSDISSDIDFQPHENVEVDLDNNAVQATSNEENKEGYIANIGLNIGRGLYNAGSALASKIEICAKSYVSSSERGSNVEFSDSTKKYVRNMQKATEKTYKVANYTVVRRLTKVSTSVGNSVGKKIYKFAPESLRSLATETMSSIVSVWDGFEQGGKLVFDSTGDAMLEVVDHKFGSDARSLAESFKRTGKYVVLMYFDYRGIGRSAILKTIAKASVKK